MHLVGFSTGSTISGIDAALFPEKVRAVALQGAPLDFDVVGGTFGPCASSVSYLDAVPCDETAIFDVSASHVGTLVDETALEEWWP